MAWGDVRSNNSSNYIEQYFKCVLQKWQHCHIQLHEHYYNQMGSEPFCIYTEMTHVGILANAVHLHDPDHGCTLQERKSTRGRGNARIDLWIDSNQQNLSIDTTLEAKQKIIHEINNRTLTTIQNTTRTYASNIINSFSNMKSTHKAIAIFFPIEIPLQKYEKINPNQLKQRLNEIETQTWINIQNFTGFEFKLLASIDTLIESSIKSDTKSKIYQKIGILTILLIQ